MQTYFLGEEEVSAYMQDLAARLVALGTQFPLVWFAIGTSGNKLAVSLLDAVEKIDPDRLDEIRLVSAAFKRDTREVQFDPAMPDVEKTRVPALVIDSSIHSGSTMLAIATAVEKAGYDTCCYSLILKRGGAFVPNFFGVVISDHDRAYFQLPEMPNNRLMPFGMIRKLSKDDIGRNRVTGDIPSLDKIDWADHWFDVQTQDQHVYVIERGGRLTAYISFRLKSGQYLFVDAIARDRDAQRGLGGELIRLAETLARHHACRAIKLWSINDRVSYYVDHGFVRDSDQTDLDLGTETYVAMTRRMLYNLPDELDC